MVSIYSPYQNSRTNYIFSQVFKYWLGVEYKVFSDIQEFSNHQSRVKINYSSEEILAGIHIPNTEFLHSKGTDQKIIFKGEGNELILFPGLSQGIFHFDLFAAVFWCITRYEEYQSYEQDQFSRYKESNSLLFQQKALIYPLADFWIEHLRTELNRCCGHDWVTPGKFEIINTIDIDNAYAIRGKGFLRNTASMGRHLLKGEFSQMKNRQKVLSGKREDDYDTYDYIHNISAQYGSKTILFYLLGDYGGYDKNLPAESSALKALITSNSTWSTCGIHPSFKSFLNKLQVKKEISRLENLCGGKVEFSRQHYLRFKLPQTYRLLHELGIKIDFTMGYAAVPGFRAGTGKQFIWYDLEKEQETSLMIQPFCVMDGTFVDYMHVNCDEAKDIISSLMHLLKKTHGTYVAIWHNETLNDKGKWEGWRSVYEYQFALAATNG